MNIFIANMSNTPIYEQIKEQIRGAILEGDLQEGDALPSIRQLAHDLKISVITTMRAYKDLEEEGFVATVQGKGCFVMPKNSEFIREQKLREIEGHLSGALTAAKMIELSDAELMQMIEILRKENQ